MEGIFFNGWFTLFRTVVVGTLAYGALIVFLRLSGKRTLSKMNAFDLVVTVSLGSTLATIALSEDVALAQGVLALALLIALQFVITWSSVRWKWVRRVVTGEPSLVLYQGAYLQGQLRLTRMTADEVRAAVRAQGYPSIESVEAVVLETDGSLSVIGPIGGAALTALEGVSTDGTGSASSTANHSDGPM